jgi:hypothetical protein
MLENKDCAACFELSKGITNSITEHTCGQFIKKSYRKGWLYFFTSMIMQSLSFQQKTEEEVINSAKAAAKFSMDIFFEAQKRNNQFENAARGRDESGINEDEIENQ